MFKSFTLKNYDTAQIFSENSQKDGTNKANRAMIIV